VHATVADRTMWERQAAAFTSDETVIVPI
jgi:hypothetical protein